MGYVIDPTFQNINRLFVLSFKNGAKNSTRDSFSLYYIPLLENKDFNVLIDNEPVFVPPVENKQEAYENLLEMSRNDDYTTRKLIDHLYYKRIVIDLSRERNTSIPKQINFVGELEEDNGATNAFYH